MSPSRSLLSLFCFTILAVCCTDAIYYASEVNRPFYETRCLVCCIDDMGNTHLAALVNRYHVLANMNSWYFPNGVPGYFLRVGGESCYKGGVIRKAVQYRSFDLPEFTKERLSVVLLRMNLPYESPFGNYAGAFLPIARYVPLGVNPYTGTIKALMAISFSRNLETAGHVLSSTMVYDHGYMGCRASLVDDPNDPASAFQIVKKIGPDPRRLLTCYGPARRCKAKGPQPCGSHITMQFDDNGLPIMYRGTNILMGIGYYAQKGCPPHCNFPFLATTMEHIGEPIIAEMISDMPEEFELFPEFFFVQHAL